MSPSKRAGAGLHKRATRPTRHDALPHQEALHMSQQIIIALRKYELNQYRNGGK